MYHDRKNFVVTYIYPMRLITHDNEEISFTLDEINNCSYNHSLLCRIIGQIENIHQEKHIIYNICGDGALAIDCAAHLTTNDLLLHINDFLCKLLLGGIYAESISAKDLAIGHLHGSKTIWPVDFGHSYNSHLHAGIRMKLTSNIETIMLDSAAKNALSISKLKEGLTLGTNIVNAINNLSTLHLLSGITELRYNNWSSAVTHLWIVAEQITDFLWERDFVECKNHDPNIPSRKQTLRQDHRTYSASVKQEILYQINVIPQDVYSIIYAIRKSRNKLIHEGKMVDEAEARNLYIAIDALLRIATCSEKDRLLPEIASYPNSFFTP